jgi:hypothetical protein
MRDRDRLRLQEEESGQNSDTFKYSWPPRTKTSFPVWNNYIFTWSPRAYVTFYIRRHSTTFYYIRRHSTTFYYILLRHSAPPRRAKIKVFYLQPTSPDTMSNVYDNITRWPQCSENLHLQGAVVIVRMHSGWKRWMQWGPVAENVVATSAATKHPQI